MLSSKHLDDSPRGFWYGLINFEHRLPTPDDFKIDRMRKVLDLLGNPEKKINFVHVAGSKGKGSTSAMLAAILSQGFILPPICFLWKSGSVSMVKTFLRIRSI